MKNTLLVLVLFLLTACGTTKKPYFGSNKGHDRLQPGPPKKAIHSLYLIGDTGDSDGRGNYALLELQRMLEEESAASSIVFLGDQIYRTGMPKKKSPDRKRAENILNEQLDILKNYAGRAYFIAGEKDWNNGKAKGLKALKRQEDYLENYYPEKQKVKFYPSNGCADPKVVKITKDLIFVFLNTQWWLQDWTNEKKINQGCDIKSKYDLLKHIEEILTSYKNDEVVIFTHHPIYSNGNHGGCFSLKDHLFPFLESNNLAIPLPIIGSLVPIARNITGTKQDLVNAHYQGLMSEIENRALKLKMHVLFASAHDNGLQHFDRGKLQYVVSGSGSRTNHIGRGGTANFAYQKRGFCKVLFYEEFEAWLEVYALTNVNQKAELVYRVQLRAPRPGTVEDAISYPPINIPDTTLAANSNFKGDGLKKTFLGEQYRAIWATPVKAPVIDLENHFGGLIPVKKGGGMASNSLRVQKADGKQYILRSINKDYRKLVPADFGNLKLLDIMKDQNSASHPYGALIIPMLSKAAGVYYTHPKLVYLKHQKGLGNYNTQFPEELYLLEERPSGDWRDAEQFGQSSEIIGYTDLLEILREKKNHFVDQNWVCKSRLFDLLIHDWDRHDDQWRWATFKEGDKTVYRPIPRDRDQAFYKFVGIVPTYVSIFLMKQFKTMKADVKDIKNLAFNAKHFDRHFMNELEWKDWEKEIIKLQRNLTDEVVEQSIDAFPPETRGLDDAELIYKLKSRRNKLLEIGRKLYDFISKEVEITGTDNDDIFEITGEKDGNILVKVYVKRKDKGNLLKYKRTFYPKETKEIRLYGLRGKDVFTVMGASNNSISVRVIGGEDKDHITNETKGRKIIVYDDLTGIEMEGPKLKDKRSADLEVNEYDRHGFTYNANLPTVSFGSTQDDGFWIGGAFSWTAHAWRKTPYQSRQKIAFSIAPGSQDAIQLTYDGHFPKTVGQLDFSPSFALNYPRYENYFGLGNESINPGRETQFNWVRLQSLIIEPMLQVNSKEGNTTLHFGPLFESHDIKNTVGRVSADEALGFRENEFERRNFLGARLKFQTGFVNDGVFPANGFKLGSSLHYLNSLSKDEEVVNFDANMQFYLTLVYTPKIVLANNIGYQKIFGEPQFYQYPDLGNTTNLRGFRNNRFRGKSAFYQNIDLRMHLFKWNNNWLPMDVGIIGGYDYGRVWLSEENSEQWHNSQTIGVWMNILGMAVLQPHYSFTGEGNAFSLRIGFNF